MGGATSSVRIIYSLQPEPKWSQVLTVWFFLHHGAHLLFAGFSIKSKSSFSDREIRNRRYRELFFQKLHGFRMFSTSSKDFGLCLFGFVFSRTAFLKTLGTTGWYSLHERGKERTLLIYVGGLNPCIPSIVFFVAFSVRKSIVFSKLLTLPDNE